MPRRPTHSCGIDVLLIRAGCKKRHPSGDNSRVGLWRLVAIQALGWHGCAAGGVLHCPQLGIRLQFTGKRRHRGYAWPPGRVPGGELATADPTSDITAARMLLWMLQDALTCAEAASSSMKAAIIAFDEDIALCFGR